MNGMEPRNPSSMPAPEAWSRASGDPGLAALAGEVAGLQPDLDGPFRRRLHLLITLLLTAQAEGSTRLPLAGPELEARHLAFGEAPVDWAAFLDDPRLGPLVGGPEDGRPLVRLGMNLASLRMVASERAVLARIRAMGAVSGPALEAPEALLSQPLPLSPEQRTAVAGALGGALTLITGGPGTGKTAILSALVRSLLASGLEADQIALAAPTGRAAQRMGQALAGIEGAGLPEPRTLHRLLGWDGRSRRFRHGPGRPLRVRALLIDEASMVGLELMEALLGALPAGAKLVLLGDADQLPSVEAGAVFRDLVAAWPQRTFRLTHSHRMDAADPGGRAILAAARAIGEGRGPELEAASADGPFGAPGISTRPADEASLKAFLGAWLGASLDLAPPTLHLQEGGLGMEDAATLAGLLARFEPVRLLCLLREGPSLRSSDGINAYLHAEAAKRLRLDSQSPFLPGEPVMARHNDYARGLFNGDQGLVVRVIREGGPRLEAVFPRPEGPLFFPLDAIQAGLEHAYALTVHKAQGSEFERVALVLPEGDHPLLTREILYTALTRAKRSVIILGDPALLALGASRPMRREGGFGGLNQGLRGDLPCR